MVKLIGAKKVKTAVFISGKGSNLNNLIKFSKKKKSPITIDFVVSNKKNAKGLNFAKKNKIDFKICSFEKNSENKILKILYKKKIKLICLAGFMKILTRKFINKFNGKIINIHPSLLPKFKGLNTFKRVLTNNEKKTGCTVHFVNEKLDNGKIISQKSFFIGAEDDEEKLKNKTQKLEYLVFPESIIKIFQNN